MTEDQLEQETLGWLAELGYAVHSDYDIAREDALHRVRPRYHLRVC